VSTNDPLTPEQKEHIELIFHRYEENLNRQYDDAIKGELELLRKYKADLARAYDEVRGQRKTLVSLMEDIVNRQEELIGITIQINEFIYRIENFFLTDTPPKQPKQEPIEDDLLIADLFAQFEMFLQGGLEVRTVKALKAESIVRLSHLKGFTVRDLAIIPNLGAKSVAAIIYVAGKSGIEIPFLNNSYASIRRELKYLRDRYGN